MQVDIDLGPLSFSEGGHLLVKRALRKAGAGNAIIVSGTSPDLGIDLRAWCRDQGHLFNLQSDAGRQPTQAVVVNGGAEANRWTGAERAGEPNIAVSNPPRRWGLAARGATVEAGTPEFDF